ncbi:hypothetical protein ADK52_09620 [Streptomyces sp. WM6372]|nr:hypothetical protein ADK52_09620 [Streptomyces sp. WM6372]
MEACLQLVGGLVLAAAGGWGITQLARGGQNAGDTSSIVSMVAAVAGLLLARAGLNAARLSPGQPDDARRLAEGAVDTLAGTIAKDEAGGLGAMVGQDGHRLNLSYSRRPDDRLPGEAPPHGQLEHDSASGVPDIATYYERTSTGRLVITGPPGAGKTVLSVELLMRLIGRRTAGAPVPVRLSLAEWNTDTPFEHFLAAQVVQNHGISPQRAAWIIEHRLLIPVLDGLDEMDPGLTTEGGAPVYGPDGLQLPDPRAPRALKVLRALNAYGPVAPGLPLILVCRTGHYNALPVAERLWHAAGIDIAPLGRVDIEVHLTHLFRHDERWRAFLAALPTHWSGALRETLSTPWWLFLLKTVYQRGGDPTELFGYATEQALREHLLSLFIPAVVDLHPTSHDAESIRRWLGTIARHLAPGPVGAERTDIHRQRLWPIAGRIRVRCLDAVTVALAFLLLLPIPFLGGSANPWAMAATICLGAALTAHTALQFPSDPACVPWGRVFSRATATLLIDSLPAVLVLAPLGGLLALPLAWLAAEAGFSSFVAFLPALAAFWAVRLGIVNVIGSGITQAYGRMYAPDTNAAVKWRHVFRGDLLIGCVALVAAGMSVMAAWWVMSFSDVLVLGSTPGPDAMIMGLLAVCMKWASLFGGGRRYLVFVLCLGRRLPRRLGRFLDWAYKGGLLRTAGGAYQFRHREFQKWLAATSTAEVGRVS